MISRPENVKKQNKTPDTMNKKYIGNFVQQFCLSHKSLVLYM